MNSSIIDTLFTLQDISYGDFHGKLLPGYARDCIIGVRTPLLRKYAKELAHDDVQVSLFLTSLPHTYFEENQLHGFLISGIKDFDQCILRLQQFLPYIDNWATCDQTSPVIFKKNKARLLPFIDTWLCSSHVYTIRFAIGMLMQHFLDDEFKKEYIDKVCSVTNDDYYVKMEIAWYLATALAKQWDATIPVLQNNILAVWTHNKTIQKAIESYRITPEQKNYLRTLRR